LLIRWGGSLNLSSGRDSDASGFQSHIDDSLSLAEHLPDTLDRLIDLGSGQGFPAIPVAIVKGIAVDMIEADRRKAAFLTTVLATLGLPGRVWTTRIETAQVPTSLTITARALAPLPRLLALTKPLLAPGGSCWFLKGPGVAQELDDAAKTNTFEFELFQTPSSRSHLVRITGLR
jgi:16S rRNA (guanine527-N7)-methyltransferase